MRGIIGAGAYLPYWRLERSEVAAFHGGRGTGTRSVASYDEDTTTLGVEAGRIALRSADVSSEPDCLWFATSDPTYLEKTNATIVHAALRLGEGTAAYDMGGAVRSGAGVLRSALDGGASTALAIVSDIRVGMANSPDELAGGDGAAAFVVGEGDGVVAEYLGGGASTSEFLDRWRSPGELRNKTWEERFSQVRYVDAGVAAVDRALAASGIDAGAIDRVVVSSQSPRAVAGLVKKIGVDPSTVMSDRSSTIGSCGAAEMGIGLVAALDVAAPGEVIMAVSMADGADVIIVRATEAISAWTPTATVADQIEAGNPTLSYSKFLSWRGVLELNPPNRPEPARMSGSAAGRSADWKYGLVASQDRESGAVHMPPARVSFVGGSVDDMDERPMADAVGTVVTFTIDRLAYSPSPPVIFAVIDFDDGGRLPMEVCDTTPDDIAVGDRVAMTFRRLNSADGIANYFWKARPVRGER